MAAFRGEVVTPKSSSAPTDYIKAYTAIHERLAVVVTGATCDIRVLACPGWQIHDVLAHLTGLCEDWVNNRLDGYASEDWTADQVARHSDLSCAQLLDRWAEALVPFCRLDQLFLGSPPARWAFGDAVVHEADVRGSLDRDRVPSDAVSIALDGTMKRWHREVLSRARVPTLHVQPPDSHDWWIGTPDDPNAVIVIAPLYEVFRALAGRRSEAQVRAWSWSSDPEPYVAAGLPYPFKWATATLSD
jgi:uncharacterized protein (TIGR03083 family)